MKGKGKAWAWALRDEGLVIRVVKGFFCFNRVPFRIRVRLYEDSLKGSIREGSSINEGSLPQGASWLLGLRVFWVCVESLRLETIPRHFM